MGGGRNGGWGGDDGTDEKTRYTTRSRDKDSQIPSDVNMVDAFRRTDEKRGLDNARARRKRSFVFSRANRNVVCLCRAIIRERRRRREVPTGEHVCLPKVTCCDRPEASSSP